MTLGPSGHSLTPVASQCWCYLAWSLTRKPMTFHLSFCHSFFGGVVIGCCLPVCPYFQYISGRGENAEDVFVNLTWKCFFFSTSCFHRPFVRSNCAACHPPHGPPLPTLHPPFSPLGGAMMCWSGRKAFFDFCIISCAVQSGPPDFLSIPVLICCPNLRLHLRKKTSVYLDTVTRKMGYLQFLDETGNGCHSAGVSRKSCQCLQFTRQLQGTLATNTPSSPWLKKTTKPQEGTGWMMCVYIYIYIEILDIYSSWLFFFVSPQNAIFRYSCFQLSVICQT